VKKSVVCRSRPPPNGMNPASSRVSILLTKPSSDPGASPLSACSRSPGANFEAQPAFVEYLVSLMRVRSSIAPEYTPALLCGMLAGVEIQTTRFVGQALGSTLCTKNMPPDRRIGFRRRPSLSRRRFHGSKRSLESCPRESESRGLQ
jgi:hypothetical protein